MTENFHNYLHIFLSFIQGLVVTTLLLFYLKFSKKEKIFTQESVIVGIVDLLHDKSEFYHTHSKRVGLISAAICDALSLDSELKEKIRMGAMVHDIGKIYIDAEWLERNGALTPKEWEEIKLHPVKGANLLRKLKVDSDIVTMALYHHENYDGTGYPLQISDFSIPMGARIIRVADAIEAMASRRPYRPIKSFLEIEEELVKGVGTQFDKEIVKVCTNGLSKRIKLILLNYA